jgi:D-xylose transport system substrate-binding protein
MDANNSQDPEATQVNQDNLTDQKEDTSKEKDKSNKSLLILLIVLFVIIIIGVAAYFLLSNKEEETNEDSNVNTEISVIGLSLATLRTERWQRDRDYIIEEAKKYNAIVNVTDANSDADLQVTQAENLILQGVDVLIVVAVDSEVAAEIVDLANENNVEVIAYDRLILDSDLNYYVSFDSVEVGRIQAQGVINVVDEGKFAYIGGSETDNNAHLVKEGSMEVLDPYIDSGQIELVLNVFTPDWKQEEAYETMKDFLADGGEVDAVVAANDGTAFGVIQALKEYNLEGKVPVSGQDAELTACQRVVEGTQTVTVYKSLSDLAKRAVIMAMSILNGETVETTGVENNGEVDVPSYLIEPVAVTKDNMIEVIIDDGFHSFDDVYKNVPEGERPEYNQ